MGQQAIAAENEAFDLGALPAALPRLSTAEIAIIGGDEPYQALFRDSGLATAALSQLQPARRSLRAAADLGADLLRNAALVATVDQRVFAVPGFHRPLSRLRIHSIATAHLTEVVCQHVGLDEPLAFLAGLLHDVAPAAAAVGLRLRDPATLAAAWPSLLAASADAAWLLGESWLVPNRVREAIDSFHRFAPEYDPLAAALTIADALALELVADRRERALDLLPPSPAEADAAAALGLDGEAGSALRDAAPVHLESIAAVMAAR